MSIPIHSLRFAYPFLALSAFLATTVSAQSVFPTNGGNVGIGTTTPTAARLSFGSADGAQIVTTLPGGVHGATLTHYYGGTYLIMRSADSWNERVRISASAGNASYINSGFFGLGNANPVAMLDVTNAYSSGVDSIRLTYNDGNAYWMGIKPYVVADGDVGYLFRTTNGPTTVNALAITGKGNVGVGTDVPYGRFEVAAPYVDFSGGFAGTQAIGYVTSTSIGAKDAGATIVLRGRTGNQVDYYPFAGFKGAKQTSAGDGNYAGYLGIFTQASNGAFYERMRLDGSGNVGIGETNPSSKLMISGSVAAPPVISLNESNVRQWKIGPALAGSGKLSVQNGSTGTDAMTVDATNNVGIGTSSPTHKLSVNGAIRAKEVIVETTGWPDYVFAKGYERPGLEETARFIKENGHLPGVPSAQEVNDNGISVGKMQAVLLKKIEELTLNQIELNEKVRQLQEENAKLQRRLGE